MSRVRIYAKQTRGLLISLIAGGLLLESVSSAFCAAETSAPGAAAPAAAFQPRKGTFQLLESSGTEKDHIAFLWETNDDADWSAPYEGRDPIYADFAKWVRARTDPGPRALLRRNRAAWREKGRSTRRYDLILGGKLGKIRPINRLEAEILLLQLDRFGKPYSGEFLAFILRKAGKLRVYGYATGGRTIRPGSLRRGLQADIADHWEFAANLHNHPFVFSRRDATSGELYPSGDASDGDVQYYLADAESFKLRRACITNGFDTIEIPDTEFPALEATPDK